MSRHIRITAVALSAVLLAACGAATQGESSSVPTQTAVATTVTPGSTTTQTPVATTVTPSSTTTQAPATAQTTTTKPKPKPTDTDPAKHPFVAYVQENFAGTTWAEFVKGAHDDVLLWVYTDLYPDSDAIDPARKIAFAASQYVEDQQGVRVWGYTGVGFEPIAEKSPGEPVVVLVK